MWIKERPEQSQNMQKREQNNLRHTEFRMTLKKRKFSNQRKKESRKNGKGNCHPLNNKVLSTKNKSWPFAFFLERSGTT